LVVALDRFMAERLRARGVVRGEMVVSPPWPHEDRLEDVPHDTNPFRLKHGLSDKFVVMYSGNHSPSNPLTTVLEAALRLRDVPRFQFAFVGGGLGKREVEEFAARHQLTNVLSLPYQPLADLRYSLSAADVHLVSLGDGMVGIIHPCKVYGAMAVGRPVLYLGPKPSHIADLIDDHRFGVQVCHGDAAAAERAIRSFEAMSADERNAMGAEAKRVLESSLSMQQLRGRFCDAVEESLGLTSSKPRRQAVAVATR
jgi:glycosyltransferase involved in cell wall biosynthesis